MFGVHKKEKGCTTKRAQGREKYQYHGSRVDFDKEGRAPSRIQVSPHGRTCITLR